MRLCGGALGGWFWVVDKSFGDFVLGVVGVTRVGDDVFACSQTPPVLLLRIASECSYAVVRGGDDGDRVRKKFWAESWLIN